MARHSVVDMLTPPKTRAESNDSRATPDIAPWPRQLPEARLATAARGLGEVDRGAQVSELCASAWVAPRLLKFVEPLEGEFWADQARRLHWARTRTFAAAAVVMSVAWPPRLIRSVWDTEFGNGNATVALMAPFIMGALGLLATAVVGRRQLWGWMGGGVVTPATRFWASVASMLCWTVGVATFTIWTTMWCVASGVNVQSDEGCRALSHGEVPYLLFINVAVANLCLGTIMRWRWWVASLATIAFAAATSVPILPIIMASNSRTTLFPVLLIPIVTAYAAERADRHQYLLQLVHFDQREQTLSWQNQFHEAQLQARTAEQAMLRRTLGFLLHECGNVLHGLQSVVETWEAPTKRQAAPSTGSASSVASRIDASRLHVASPHAAAGHMPTEFGSSAPASPLGASPVSAVPRRLEPVVDARVRVTPEDVRIVAFGVASLRQLCSDGLDSQKLAAGRLRVHQTRQQVVRLARTVVRSYRLTSAVPIRLEVDRAFSKAAAAALPQKARSGDGSDASVRDTSDDDSEQPSLPDVWIDAHRARQILANGVTNAVKMCEKGSITVRVGLRYRHGGASAGEAESKAAPPGVVVSPTLQSGSGTTVTSADPSQAGEVDVVFCVEDTGPGLRGATPESLFEDYTQSSDMRVAAKGSGLGLPLARRLVRLMGGSIGLEEDKERGVTRFWFSVPGEAPRPGGRTAKAMREAERRLAAARKSTDDRLSSVASMPSSVAFTTSAAGASRAVPALSLSVPIDEHTRDAATIARGESNTIDGTGTPDGSVRSFVTPPPSPLLRSDMPVVWPSEAESVAEADGDAPALGLHLAVCDDEPLNLKIAARMLRQLGCTCDTYLDGDELPEVRPDARLCGKAADGDGRGGPDASGVRPYDAVLLDSVMARVSGPDAARALRAGGLTVPIFAVTSNVAVHDLQLYKAAGMDAVLPKPFKTASLRMLLRVHVLGARRLSMLATAARSESPAGAAPSSCDTASATEADVEPRMSVTSTPAASGAARASHGE